VHDQYIFYHGIIVQRLLEKGMVKNIIQCFDLFQGALCKKNNNYYYQYSMIYAQPSKAINNKYYHYHSVIEQQYY